jgi:DNA-binding Lrp family transcriptional regulator
VTATELDSRIVRRLLLGGTPSQKELAAELGASPSNTAHAISRLEAAGILVTERAGQRRPPKLTLFEILDGLQTAIADLKSSLELVQAAA